MDQILVGFHDEGLTEAQGDETVFSFGCYVGEVLVRNHPGKGTMPQTSLLAKLGFGDWNLMVVELPNGTG